jgi:integrase
MAKKQRPKWPRFEMPELRKHQPKERKPMSVDEQMALVSYCIKHSDDWLSAVFLLELQGGMMAEEIKSLNSDDLHLDGDYPHIVLRTGKTVARPRVIPVVLGLSVVKASILEAIKRLRAVKEPSATPRKRLKAIFDGKFSSHHLRHTVRINGTANNVNPLMIEAICGWSSTAINPQMLDYGNAGLADSSDTIRSVFHASMQIHKHLLHLDEQSLVAPNVARIR